MRNNMQAGFREKIRKYDNYQKECIPIVINHRMEMLEQSIERMKNFFNMDLLFKLVAFYTVRAEVRKRQRFDEQANNSKQERINNHLDKI